MNCKVEKKIITIIELEISLKSYLHRKWSGVKNCYEGLGSIYIYRKEGREAVIVVIHGVIVDLWLFFL